MNGRVADEACRPRFTRVQRCGVLYLIGCCGHIRHLIGKVVVHPILLTDVMVSHVLPAMHISQYESSVLEMQGVKNNK